jgi:hypothetical protein
MNLTRDTRRDELHKHCPCKGDHDLPPLQLHRDVQDGKEAEEGEAENRDDRADAGNNQPDWKISWGDYRLICL